MIVANWKMNLTLPQAVALTQELITQYTAQHLEPVPLILAPPYPFLYPIQQLIQTDKNISLAAQNVHTQAQGAFTGEVSATMLQSIGCQYCIVGHSERRLYFNETNEMLLQKLKILIENNIKPIYCIGETLTQRESNQTNQILLQQLTEAPFQLSQTDFSKLTIAYEPVWAIGTGKNASPEQAQETHHFIRQQIEKQYDSATANQTNILYGGSLNPTNAQALFSMPDLNGGLIGGASLKATDLLQIINYFKNK